MNYQRVLAEQNEQHSHGRHEQSERHKTNAGVLISLFEGVLRRLAHAIRPNLLYFLDNYTQNYIMVWSVEHKWQ
jgi:hypothetical protein